MLEERKKKEIDYYDKQAAALQGERGDFEGFNPFVLSSYRFFYGWLAKHCKDKEVLDYGCGNGVHIAYPAKMGAMKVVGVDLSEKSLAIAKEKIKKQGLEGRVEAVKMDCEKMDFPDNSFDIIMDSGVFSSLDLDKAFAELARVLKPSGCLIGIETFGHNPFTNFKRRLNRLTGKRTEWASKHILKTDDLKEAKKYFGAVEARYFHLVSWMVFPFLRLKGVGLLMRLFEKIDDIFLRIPFLKKYAFKTVFIFSNPLKNHA